MKKLWISRDIDAPAEALWDLLTQIEFWPAWGPSVRSVDLDGERLKKGSTGTLTTVLGLRLGFKITGFESNVGWSWEVAGLEATEHRVERRGADRCCVGFGVPWLFAPYIAVCQLALRRLDALATTSEKANA